MEFVMGKFVLAYRGGGVPSTPEEGAAIVAAWGAWFESLGSAIVEAGGPFSASSAVGGDVTANLSGYSVLQAGTLADAAALAEGCPILTDGGTVEVYEVHQMG